MIAAGTGAADLHRAVAAQGRVEGVAHSGRTGAVVDGGGGVGLAALRQAERKVARAAGLDVDFLDFRLCRALAQGNVGVAGARRGFAAQVKPEARLGQRLPSQRTHKAHDVTVTLAGVTGIGLDLNIGGVDHVVGQAFVERSVGRAHVGNGARNVAVAPVYRTHFGGRAAHQK